MKNKDLLLLAQKKLINNKLESKSNPFNKIHKKNCDKNGISNNSSMNHNNKEFNEILKNIPIIIICYNNHKYVQNTMKQIKNINQTYFKSITILDNCSDDVDTINFLKNIDTKIIRNKINNGPRISPSRNVNIYNSLPNFFIITDPDLELNTNLPTNFIETLLELSIKYKCNKIGFSLDINDFDKMFDSNEYFNKKTIYEWESQFWNDKINDDKFELYNAEIDTTFCLVNKKGKRFSNIRIAENFTCKHLPWYIENKLFSLYENYNLNKKQTYISTISKIIIPYVENKFIKIKFENDFLLINKNDTNLTYWQNSFLDDIKKYYNINQFLNKEKIFIDIGSKLGAISIFASRKSKHVYSFEKNSNLFTFLKENTNINSNNIQLNNEKTYDIKKIIDDYYKEISVINININGEEETILEYLFFINKEYCLPLFINFYYDLWQDKNLEKFNFLNEQQKELIKTNSIIILHHS